MKSMVALIKREFIEHKGAFLYAPGIIIVILALMLGGTLVSNKFEVAYRIGAPSALKFFEFGFLGVSVLWFVYLMATLFFYYADAFNADRRNNAMLFWKSMPVTDFKVLASKMLAGMTIFPALIFGALLLTAVLVYFTTLAGVAIFPRLALPGIDAFLVSAWHIVSFDIVYIAIALLWYAPFFAWVGMLSTLVGRWSIPLAFLIPGLAGLAENLLLDGRGPDGGYILNFFKNRLHYYSVEEGHLGWVFAEEGVSGKLLSGLIAWVDWPQLVGGLIVAALLVYAASEYRRRVVST